MINRIISLSIRRTLRYSIILLIMTSVAAFSGCKGKKTDEHGHAAETHTEAGEKVDDHEHAEGDGHDHSKETKNEHSEGDGHNHSKEKAGADHVEGDGHDHEKEDAPTNVNKR